MSVRATSPHPQYFERVLRARAVRTGEVLAEVAELLHERIAPCLQLAAFECRGGLPPFGGQEDDQSENQSRGEDGQCGPEGGGGDHRPSVVRISFSSSLPLVG